ncbi:hypothetical protein V2J09_023219 [Rumex salicifolius]
MKLSDIRSKFNFKALSIVLGDGKHNSIWKKPAWITQMSHGHHVVEYHQLGFYVEGSVALDLDTILVQREQISNLDIWLFGVCDNGVISGGISGYLESHLFDKEPKEARFLLLSIKQSLDMVITKCKETMRKANLNAREKCKEAIKEVDRKGNVGSASASVIVINEDKFVIAAMGEYRAVVCTDGMATEIRGSTTQGKRQWPHKAILGALHIPKVRVQARRITTRSWRNSEIEVSSRKVDSDTEFIILGSPGVWKVMKSQEAVNLISHIEDAQKAAECLAKEAMARNCKRNISCLTLQSRGRSNKHLVLKLCPKPMIELSGIS